MLPTTIQNRREVLKNLALIVGSAAFISPASALATAVPPVSTELASDRPKVRRNLLDTMEVAVGAPSQYLPKARILTAVLQQAPNGQDQHIQAWQQLISTFKNAPAIEQIRAVHQFFNQVTYVSDAADAWKTPSQFLVEGGDCEDYAIAKFVTLRQMGFHQDRVRILFVKNTLSGIDHAVTVVYLDGQALVLDNNHAPVVRTEAVAHYNPLCSFDERRLWLHWVPGGGNKAVAGLQQRVANPS